MFNRLQSHWQWAVAIVAALGLAAGAAGLMRARSPANHEPVGMAAAAALSVAQEGQAPDDASAEPLLAMLRRVFAEEGVPPEYLWVAEVESAWNPHAQSRAGAVGLFQIMPETARRFDLADDLRDERADPESNARTAARYLNRLHKRFGDWTLVLAAYNAGENRVQRLLLETGGNDYEDIRERLPAETRAYVAMVQAIIEEELRTDANVAPP